MKILLIFFSIMLSAWVPVFAVNYVKIAPELITEAQSVNYKAVNETTAIIYNKLKPKINTSKYPKYYHDFTKIFDDGTQNKNYIYVKSGNAELIYNSDSHELKFVSFRRPELQKCRIIYDYPAGNLHAVQIYPSEKEIFVFSADGKYIDYSPYGKEVQAKVMKNWKVPERKRIEVLAKDKTDLPVQITLTLNRDGTVKKCKILKSSKIKELDDNAILAIKSAAPFEPFPDKFFNEELVIILNFNFSL